MRAIVAEDAQRSGVERHMLSLDHWKLDPARCQRGPEMTVREQRDVAGHRVETRNQPVGTIGNLRRGLAVGAAITENVPVRSRQVNV